LTKTILSFESTQPTQLPYRFCAGIMLVNRDGKVWVGYRRPKWLDPGVDGYWQMPQGGINAGEAPAATALRELREETGVVHVRALGEIGSWLTYDLPANLVGVALKGRYRGQSQRWFAMRFEGCDSEIDITARNGLKPEFSAWRWADIEEVLRDVVPFKRPIYQTVFDTFQPFTRTKNPTA
jgi:putative (di)nucleoside polyphosphate hydrolase